jgi:glutamine synthetase
MQASQFGRNVFGDDIMRDMLSSGVYESFRRAIELGEPLEAGAADEIANAMKVWAIERGATHYAHWFQPMTGLTAEKQESFIHLKRAGNVVMEFSGKELIKGEPDASSFPNGGLRATFEARGYTAWDPTSPVFIKDGVLCIPTAFCSYKGHSLDKKTPLLRSMEALSAQAKRLLALFEITTGRVYATVGGEQEYFLIDRQTYEARRDIKLTGRTLFGAPAPKGQELDEHYYGRIKPRVLAFMKEVDEKLWELGVPSKTRHNEVAPAQHELAPIHTIANIAADHNQLMMETLMNVAAKHDLACLLHEKPFSGVNGSGKHNNWSICTSDGMNLLEPGNFPHDNSVFLIFLCAVIKAVDDHQDLLRISVASPGNDHRLGAHEAPPAIISMFLGDELTRVLESIESGAAYDKIADSGIESGVRVLPKFMRDTTDRNRTSPFAFTGNKFEFRMPGSSLSISGVNVIMNTIVSDVLCEFADKLEGSRDLNADLSELLRGVISEHKRIIFNGNNYSAEWEEEATHRGLLNIKTSAEAFPLFESDKNIKLFTKHGIFTEAEIRSRCKINLENYCKVLRIEALTMIDMIRKDIIPAALAFESELADTATTKKTLSAAISCDVEEKIITKVAFLASSLFIETENLAKTLAEAEEIANLKDKAERFMKTVASAMRNVRTVADDLETHMPREFYPFPSYGDILYSV